MGKINSEREEITQEEFRQYVEKMMDQDGRAGLSAQAQEAIKELPSPERIEAYRERLETLYENERIANPSSQPDKPELLELYPIPVSINEQGQKELMQLPEYVPMEDTSDTPRAIPPMLPPDQPELLELYPVPEMINEQGEKVRMEMPEKTLEVVAGEDSGPLDGKVFEAQGETAPPEKIEVVPHEAVNEPMASVTEPEAEKIVEQVPEPVHETVVESTTNHDEGRSQDSRSESGGD